MARSPEGGGGASALLWSSGQDCRASAWSLEETQKALQKPTSHILSTHSHLFLISFPGKSTLLLGPAMALSLC